ncbi:hypothetical protein EDB84DRAFT_1260529 [Lactarius hengduanensis]|nr:hypothetical protein EDB84DRAFT_1260529 [Lactarius hengduanensis]
MWHSTNTAARRAATGAPVASATQDDLTRHWSFTAFEWVVHDVAKLRDFVEDRGQDEIPEGRVGPDRDGFEILKESPMLGDGKYKLEIGTRQLTSFFSGLSEVILARTPSDAEVATVQLPTLSLYVTSLMLDYANAEYEISASMLAAIKCQDDRVGERGARADWAWDTWQTEWTFRQDNEVWQCALPSLSSLLENPRICQTDSFVICIQIHTPTGPFFPQHPSAYYVPRDLLEGLEASLDNSNTGDVQFICLEKASRDHSQTPASPTPPNTANSESQLSSSSSHSPSGSKITARKRVIYAHSDILIRRSDYFSSMLSSAFAETMPSGERKTHTIVVEEADFVTIYWLLKWVYANWLLFKEEDDPRSAVEGIGAGWSARWLSPQGTDGEWDWKMISKNNTIDDNLSAASGDSAPSLIDGRASGSSQGKPTFQGNQPTSPAMRSAVQRPSSASKAPHSSTLRSTSAAVPRRGTVPDSSSISISVPASAHSSSGHAAQPMPIGSSRFTNVPQRPHGRTSVTPSSGDPHPHPTSTPPPASALSVYQIAHRYGMPGLATLALEHMMATITPRSCFALLLASVVWDELHSLVEDFVVERWSEVQISEEFERGCAEVAAGEWGPDGGKTMMALFRRLRSPAAAAYTRG